jgi:hypothetical protein
MSEAMRSQVATFTCQHGDKQARDFASNPKGYG